MINSNRTPTELSSERKKRRFFDSLNPSYVRTFGFRHTSDMPSYYYLCECGVEGEMEITQSFIYANKVGYQVFFKICKHKFRVDAKSWADFRNNRGRIVEHNLEWGI